MIWPLIKYGLFKHPVERLYKFGFLKRGNGMNSFLLRMKELLKKSLTYLRKRVH
jgi:hypothetical protein